MAAKTATAAKNSTTLVVQPEPSGRSLWAKAAHARAAAQFRVSGVPGHRDEYWRFTDPASLTAAAPVEAPLFTRPDLPPFGYIDRLVIAFRDGQFDPSESDDLTETDLEIQLLSDVLSQDLHWASEVFGTLEHKGQTPVPRALAALNTANATEGVVIRATGKIKRPVSLRYLNNETTSDAILHHVIVLEPDAELTLLESGTAAARLNAVFEVVVGDRARFNHVRTQGRAPDRRSLTHLFGRLGAASHLSSFTLAMNGALTRNETVIEFTGDHAFASVSGACVGDTAHFHNDDTVFVTHGAEHCVSRQVFKKVLRNGATGVFQGKILVKQGAQKTDGYQISQALLLDDDSTFLVKPELEIYADDVACSHGSTCGAVDELALFYLTSRGIPSGEAQDMLVLAFLAEAMDEIDNADLAADITDRLAGWLERHHA